MTEDEMVGITDSMDMHLSKLQMVKVRGCGMSQFMGFRESDRTERLNNSIIFNDFTHAIVSVLNRHVGLDTYSVITPLRLCIKF